MCGGTGVGKSIGREVEGLSPSVRGNQLIDTPPQKMHRSIPACAGEPTHGSTRRERRKVYPRVCGGTGDGWPPRGRGTGLSPRVRGNPLCSYRHPSRRRSIPACAGEPWRSYPHYYPGAVYPRVCGGTGELNNQMAEMKGLSPRVRGNQRWAAGVRPRHRSIPACAGEPTHRSTERKQKQVYPRVCGGTLRAPTDQIAP